MSEISGFHVLTAVALILGGIYGIAVRNRFKILEQSIRAAGARVGATIQYARTIEQHTRGQSRQAQQHASHMANKGARRGPRGKWRPAFFVDFNPWPEAKGIEVIIPAMQATLGGQDQAYQSRLALIEAIRVYNQELDQIPAGLVAEHFWQFRRYSYRTDHGSGGGRRHRGRRGPHGRPFGGRGRSRHRRRGPRHGSPRRGHGGRP